MGMIVYNIFLDVFMNYINNIAIIIPRFKNIIIIFK